MLSVVYITSYFTHTDDYVPVVVKAEYDLCDCDSCNCVNVTVSIEDNGVFEQESEEFLISLTSDDFTFHVDPVVVTIIDNDGW